MTDPVSLIILFFFCGLFIGAGVSYLLVKLRIQKDYMLKSQIAQDYIAKSTYDQLQQQSDVVRENMMEKEEELRVLGTRLATQEQIIINLEQQKEGLEQMEHRVQKEFENLANRLLEEKSQKFSAQNQAQIHNILQPLQEKIKSFEHSINQKFVEETRDRVSLKKEIEHLRELNQQLSNDANNLASALKGDNKTQGDWGEIQLELLLEKAGLIKDVHYLVQPNFSENGQQKRPDFVINLPEKKQLIIDSKVSLKAYDLFCQEEEEKMSKQHLKAHLDSIRQHIKGLSKKNYQELYEINSPDYLLLFIPIEPAFTLAIQEDNLLFLDALEKNIVIVSPSTLLATMRTVSFIWKQEKQKNSVIEIARQSGLLYDKFCNFVDDLKEIGQRLDQANGAYAQAMNKLVDSKKFGDTLIGRAERIKALGARTTKHLPDDLLEH
jgi:DNA recombination protein RmuC